MDGDYNQMHKHRSACFCREAFIMDPGGILQGATGPCLLRVHKLRLICDKLQLFEPNVSIPLIPTKDRDLCRGESI